MSGGWRIGLVGTESTHARAIVEYLNQDSPRLPARIVALAGGPTEQNRQLAAQGGIARVIDDIEELLGSVDALIVTTRDGRLHRRQASPFLAAGVPVWVDKPLACSRADAEAILDAAARGRTQAVSYSAVRWAPDTEALVDARREVGELQTVTVTGPADASSPYGGIFFYGIHAADVARRLAPGPTSPVRVRRVANTVVAQYDTGGPLVTLQLVEPGEGGQVPFRATLVGRHGIETRELRLSKGYLRPGVDVFLRMLESGRSPLTRDEMLDTVSVVEAVATAIGAPVVGAG